MVDSTKYRKNESAIAKAFHDYEWPETYVWDHEFIEKHSNDCEALLFDMKKDGLVDELSNFKSSSSYIFNGGKLNLSLCIIEK